MGRSASTYRDSKRPVGQGWQRGVSDSSALTRVHDFGLVVGEGECWLDADTATAHRALVRIFGERLQQTFSAIGGRGLVRYLFRLPAGCQLPGNVPGMGLDILQSGKLIVVHSQWGERQWRITNDAEPLTLTPGEVEALRALRPPRTTVERPHDYGQQSGSVSAAYARTVIAGELGTVRAAKEGSRHNTLIPAALRVFSVSKTQDVFRALLSASTLPEHESRSILTWAWDKAKARKIIGNQIRQPVTVSDVARVASVKAGDGAALFFDQLQTAKFSPGERLSRRQINRRFKVARLPQIGEDRYQRVIAHPLFTDRVMPSTADVNDCYDVSPEMAFKSTKVSKRTLRKAIYYRRLLVMRLFADMEEKAQTAEPSVIALADMFGVHRNTISSDLAAMVRAHLLEIKRRHIVKGIADVNTLPDTAPVCCRYFLRSDNYRVHRASKRGYQELLKMGAQAIVLCQQRPNQYRLKRSVYEIMHVLKAIAWGDFAPSHQPKARWLFSPAEMLIAAAQRLGATVQLVVPEPAQSHTQPLQSQPKFRSKAAAKASKRRRRSADKRRQRILSRIGGSV